MVTRHLLDDFLSAAVDAPSPRHVGLQPMTIGFDQRTGLFQHPASKVAFPPIRIGRGARLRFAIGIKEAAWSRLGSPIRFEIWAKSGWRKARLFRATLDPRHRPDDRRWVQGNVDLSGYAGRKTMLITRTDVEPPGRSEYAWAGWSDLELDHEPEPIPRPRSNEEPASHVFLITADALRADHLGCYGNRMIKTPALDRLAAEGILFEHARSDTPVTPAAYAGMLCGLHVPRHGIWSEWGTLRKGIPGLPEWFSARGYETALFTSEAELRHPEAGFSTRFGSAVPCLGHPYQDGAFTLRAAERWLEAGRTRPAFAWIQLFDTHPPSLPPAPFSSMYYAGDPRDPARAHHTDRVGRIRGLECLLEWQARDGKVREARLGGEITRRLEATVDAFRAGSATGPDLASNLLALGGESLRELPPRAFANWLDSELAIAGANGPSQDLLLWLDDVRPRLEEVESEIVGWLRGVVDMRFPLAQYAGEVSYLDHLLGGFFESLRELGIYDSSTIIFTAPHGEILDEGTVPLHHHALRESVLRVPLMIKPPAAASITTRRVAGIFEMVDLAPTLLESLGAAQPSGIDGRSHWQDVVRGGRLENGASLAFGAYGNAISATDGRFKLLRALADSNLDPDWLHLAGDQILLDLGQDEIPLVDVSGAHPEVVGRLEGETRTWIERVPRPDS